MPLIFVLGLKESTARSEVALIRLNKSTSVPQKTSASLHPKIHSLLLLTCTSSPTSLFGICCSIFHQFKPESLYHLVRYTFQKHIPVTIENYIAFTVHVAPLCLVEFLLLFFLEVSLTFHWVRLNSHVYYS